jgi:SSS family transporter
LLAALDWWVIGSYLFLLLALGGFLSRRQQSGADYFVAGRSERPFSIALSVLATQCSTNSILGAPAFVAFAAGGGLVWLQYELAVPLAMIFTMIFVIPMFQRLQLISVYEYLERRFDLKTRLLLSGVFQVLRLLAAAVTIYGVSAMIDLITGIGFLASLLIFGVFTVLYDVLGGIRAVIWSDVLQMAILVSVLGYLLWLLTSDAGGLNAMLSSVAEDKLAALDFGHHGLGDGHDFAFWPMLIGGFFLYVSYYGCDQSQVQRQLCAKSQKDGQTILLLNGVLRFPLVLLYCLIGVGIAVYAETHTEFVALLPATDGKPNYNMALPLMFLMELPDGLKGIAIVGVLAAAMSSLDSVINSLSAVTIEDFIKRCGWVSIGSDRVEILWSKALTGVWGALAIVLAFWVDDIASTVLVAVNKLGSLINGPLLAVFVMGLLTQSVTGLGARVGFAAGFISNLLLWLGAPEVSWLWWNVSGFLITVTTGVLSARRGTRWIAASHSVWTPAFFVGQGFERAWVLRYITLAGAACGFLVVLGVFGAR